MFGAFAIVCIATATLAWPPMGMWATERPSLGWSLGFGLLILLVGLYLIWESQAHGLALVRKRLALAEAEPDQHDQVLFDQWRTAFPAVHGSRLWLANFQGRSWMESQSLPIHLLATEWRAPGFVDSEVDAAFQDLIRAAGAFSTWLADGITQEVPTREGSYRIDERPGSISHDTSQSDSRASSNRGIDLARALGHECEKFERLAHAHKL